MARGGRASDARSPRGRHLPLEGMGFSHIGTEVWWDEQWTKGTVCDGSGEDRACQDQLPASQLGGAPWYHDHDLYLGHAMGCCDDRVWLNSSFVSPAPAGCQFPFAPRHESWQAASSGVAGKGRNAAAAAVL